MLGDCCDCCIVSLALLHSCWCCSNCGGDCCRLGRICCIVRVVSCCCCCVKISLLILLFVIVLLLVFEVS